MHVLLTAVSTAPASLPHHPPHPAAVRPIITTAWTLRPASSCPSPCHCTHAPPDLLCCAGWPHAPRCTHKDGPGAHGSRPSGRRHAFEAPNLPAAQHPSTPAPHPAHAACRRRHRETAFCPPSTTVNTNTTTAGQSAWTSPNAQPLALQAPSCWFINRDKVAPLTPHRQTPAAERNEDSGDHNTKCTIPEMRLGRSNISGTQ